MALRKLLIADNNKSFLEDLVKYFRLSGYDVLSAAGPEEARRVLEEEWVHLAILDLKLRDDSDNDFSGLELARTSTAAIPKIILSSHESWEAVRDALAPFEDRPPAVHFVSKREGSAVLLHYVERVFEKHVRINSDMIVEWKGRDRFSLVDLIEPGLEPERITNRADELEDLIRRLFYERDHVVVDKLLWQSSGRIAVSVHTFKESTPPESYYVVCGRHAAVLQELDRYSRCAPKAPGTIASVLAATSETTHFGSNAYALSGVDVENTRSLADLFNSGSEKQLVSSLKALFQETLADWHQSKRTLSEGETLLEWYRGRMRFGRTGLSREAFSERVSLLIHQLPTVGLRVETEADNLVFTLRSEQFRFRSPETVLFGGFDVDPPLLLSNTPGELSGDTILTVAENKSYVTDFADAGLAPLLWNFTSLEAAVRFDWLDVNNLSWLVDMERCLTGSELTRFQTGDVEASLRKTMRAIQTIRSISSRCSDNGAEAYHVGILFQAASRIARFDPASRVTNNQLVRFAHALLSAAMISSRMTSGSHLPAGKKEQPEGINIEERDHKVWVDGREIPLRRQSFNLLAKLYEQPNQLCTRRELIETVFGERYDETNESQANRLSMAIYRLRQRIEVDPESPRYLLTEPGMGYRLVLQRL